MEILAIIGFFVLGLSLGTAGGWLIADRKARGTLAAAQTACALAEQQLTHAQADLARRDEQQGKELGELTAAARAREELLEQMRTRLGEAEKRNAAAEEAIKASQKNEDQQRQVIEAARNKLFELEGMGELRAAAEEKITGMASEIERRESQNASEVLELKRHQATLDLTIEKLRTDLASATNRYTAASEALKASQDNITEQKKLLEDAKQTLTAAFAEVSRDALERASGSFVEMAKTKFDALSADAGGALEQRKEQISAMLEPMKEMLKNYQDRIDKIEVSRVDAYAKLLQEIGGMSEAQRILSQQTKSLETALKKSSVRGRWGEVALRRLVEMAGMSERVDFVEQESIQTEEGLRRPDMVVKLSGNRSVVIDSKAVLAAFLSAAEATEDSVRTSCLQQHAKNVKSRVDDLSNKAYWTQFQNTPEFAVLFLPGEGFLNAACDHDAGLIEYALGRKILLATPTTLLLLLHTVERGWRQEAIGENAEAIRKLGVEIYDRLAILADNLTKLGRSLDGAVDHFNKVVGTVEGRVLVSARKMGELGARSDKTIGSVASVEIRPREFAAELHPEKFPS